MRGHKHGVMVNSGSSANLLALFVLTNPTLPNPIKPGDEVITPALTWNTTVSPILMAGAVPMLVDVRLEDCTIDTEKIESAITSKTKAIMPVHLLGNPAKMETILKLAKKYNLYIIEDTCEAPGAHFQGKKCGSMGHIGTFSFFFSHHITTIEGGMLVTDDDWLADLARIMRSQGVIRNTQGKKELEQHYKNTPEYGDIDPSFLFANLGFNLRPTELNGGFGIEQVKKIDSFIKQREENGTYWIERLKRYSDLFYFPTLPGTGSSWFYFSLIIKPGVPFTRRKMAEFLNSRKIETRPIMSGNMARQPVLSYFPYRKQKVPHAQLVHENGFCWGLHQGIKKPHREYVADCVDEFVREYC